MTEEELKQEAEESFEQYKVTDEDYVVSPYSDDMGEKMLMYNDEYYAEETYLRLYTEGYLAGAEPREKRIAELEETLGKCAKMPVLYCLGAKETITEAKGIIKDLCGMVRELNKPNVQLTNVDYSLSKAEAFLKE